jgi:hypothetical protein
MLLGRAIDTKSKLLNIKGHLGITPYFIKSLTGKIPNQDVRDNFYLRLI